MKSFSYGALFVGLWAVWYSTVSVPAHAQSQEVLFAQEIRNVHDIPTDPPAGLGQTDLAWYAWRLFAAVNQGTTATLQDGAGRETPAWSFLSTGMTAGPLPHPTLFEGLYHRTEAYPYYTGAAPPSPLNQVPTYRFSGGFTVTGGQYVNLDETNQIGQNYIYYRQSESPDFPILFMAKVNSTEVKYAQAKAAAKQQPSPKSSWLFPPNTLEIKSAWRLVADVTHPENYHQAVATWYAGEEGTTPKVKTDTFALIGLHIIQKSANYPSFIYTTFEHVDAVTRDQTGTIVDPAYELTYDTLDYDATTGPNPVTSFTGAYSVNAPGLPLMDNVTTKNFMLPPQGPAPSAAHPPSGLDGNYKVAYQPQTITQEVNDVNNRVRSMLPGTVWQNYRLKGVQATPTSDQTSLDYYLANIVIETSQPGVQLFHGNVAGTGGRTFTNERSSPNVAVGLVEGKPVPPPKYNMGGCMGCHGVAQSIGSDFSFLPPDPLHDGHSADSVPLQAAAEALAAHKKAVAKRRISGFFDR